MKKLLADGSVDFRIVKSLRADEYDVEAIVEISPGISDDDVLNLANELIKSLKSSFRILPIRANVFA